MRRQRSEFGGALAETSVIIPLSIFLLAGLVDLSSALNHFITLNHICYEASRVASDIPRLEDGDVGNVHNDLREKINSLLRSYNTEYYDAVVTTNFNKAADRVTVSISDNYKIKLLPIGSGAYIPLTATLESPYLFRLDDEAQSGVDQGGGG